MIHNLEPTEQQAAWQIFEREYLDQFPLPLGDTNLDHAFVVDESYIAAMLYEPELKLTLTRAQARAALEYWRAKKIEAVEKVAAEYRAKIETSERFSKAPKSGYAADEADVL